MSVEVAVEGGALHVGRWGARGPTVLAFHGITGNHLAFARLSRELGDDVQLVAPDLRGRGRSATVGPPYGIRAHVADAVAILDDIGAEDAVVVGHSMGGWVAAVLAVLHPARVRRLVLVDGGAALPGVASLDVDAALHAVLGPALARLEMTFEDRDAHLDFWRRHPAYARWDDDVERYVDYDLAGEPPAMRSTVSIDAVRGDATEQLAVPEVRDALESVPVPTVFLWAPRGLLDADPLYPRDVLDANRRRWPAVEEIVALDDVNHYTAVVGEGAAQVAVHVRKAVAG